MSASVIQPPLPRVGTLAAVLMGAALLAGFFLAAYWEGFGARSREVTVTAYVASEGGRIGAWDNPLDAGERMIAVSRDLHRAGLVQGTRVRIAGLPGIYTVQDLMPPRWTNRVDVYMGDDHQAMRAFGTRTASIRW